MLVMTELNAGKNLTKATTIKDKVVRTDNISLFELKVINTIVTIRIIANVSNKSFGIL